MAVSTRIRAALAVLSVLSWPLAAHAQSDNWDDVVARAKQEGTVTLYSLVPGTLQKPLKMFEETTGIRVIYLEGRPSEVTERIRTEQVTGRRSADVSFSSPSVDYANNEAGLLQPFGTIPNAKNATIDLGTNYNLPLYSAPYGILLNTTLVKPEDEPKSWKDLTDPKWKGKMLASEPGLPGGGSTWFDVMNRTFGLAYHEAMAKQHITFSVQSREAPRQVARGEYPLYFPYAIPNLAEFEGLPMKVVVPVEGAPYSIFTMNLVKNAPHPNAGRVLLNFLLGHDAQLAYAQYGNGPVIGGLVDLVPPNRRAAITAKLLDRQQVTGQDERFALAKKIYGR